MKLETLKHLNKFLAAWVIVLAFVQPGLSQTNKIALSAQPLTNSVGQRDLMEISAFTGSGNNYGGGTRAITYSNFFTTLVASGMIPVGTLNSASNALVTSLNAATASLAPTNSPTMKNVQVFNYIIIQTNASFPGLNGSTALMLPYNVFEQWGTNGPTIRYNLAHSGDAEFEMASPGRWCIIAGQDNQAVSSIQLGSFGPTHEDVYLNQDVDPNGTDATFRALPQLFGPSKILHFESGWKDTGNVIHVYQTGIKSETFDQNGDTEIRVYNPAVQGPAAIGVGIANGKEQIAVATNGFKIDGGQFFGINATNVPPGSNYVCAWSNSIDNVTVNSSSLTIVTTNFPPYGSRKDVLFYGTLVNVALTFPTGWTWAGIMPTTLTNSTIGRLELISTGSNDTAVVATWLGAGNYTVPIDADAQKFFLAAGAGNLTSIQSNYVNFLATQLKANNVWTNWDFIYPYTGLTSNSMSWNLVNTNLFRIAWTTNGDTFTASGWLSDGTTTSYADTKFNPSTATTPKYSQNSALLAVYNGTANPAYNFSGTFIGGVNGISVANAICIGNSSGLFSINGGNLNYAITTLVAGVSSYKGFLAVDFTNSPSTVNYALGGTVAANSIITPTGFPNADLFVGNLTAGGGDRVGALYEFAGAGHGLTPAQLTTVQTIVTAAQTLLGRP